MWVTRNVLLVFLVFSGLHTSGSGSNEAKPSPYLALRINIKRFNEKNELVHSVSSLERYSNLHDDDSPRTTDAGSAEVRIATTSFYYRHLSGSSSSSGIWLQVATSIAGEQEEQQQCSASNQEELDLALYGQPLPSKDSYLLDDRVTVGAANLLQLMHHPKLSKRVVSDKKPAVIFGPPISATIEDRNVEGELDLKDGGGRLRLEATYINEIGALPIKLRLTYQISSGPFTLLIDYHTLEQVHAVANPNIPEQPLILFPLALGCSRTLAVDWPTSAGVSASGVDLSSFASSIENLAFSARIIEKGSESASETMTMHFLFNFHYKLLRRDVELSEHHGATDGRAVSIYDFKRDLKYHFRTSSDMSGSQQDDAMQCIRNSWKDATRVASLEFIPFERLQFMGTRLIHDQIVHVYEDGQLDRLPFWLAPMQNGPVAFKTTLVGRISLVYYFTATSDESRSSDQPLGNLILIELQMRNPSGRLVLLDKKLEIYDFTYDRQPVELLSLVSAGCTGAGASGYKRKSMQLSLVLQPHKSSGTNEGSVDTEIWSDRLARDEALLRAMVRKFNMQRTHIDYLHSRRLGESTSPLLDVEVGLSQLMLPEMECVFVGRGFFIHGSRPVRAGAFALEDCILLAHHFSQSQVSGAEVVFAHDQTKSLCTIDRLYIWRELQAHEAAIANSTDLRANSLSYMLYDMGEPLFKLNYKDPKKPDHQQTSWLQRKKSLELVGLDLSVPVQRSAPPKSQLLEVQYLLKHAHLTGHLASAEDPLSLAGGQQIKGVGFMQTSEDQPMLGQRYQVMTKSLCRSLCLMNSWCQSYSFCDFRFRPECSLSALDISQSEIGDQLYEGMENARQAHVRQITLLNILPAGAAKIHEEILLRLDKKCFIAAKPYVKLFDKSYQIKVDPGEKVDMVSSENECAKLCFNQNLDYLKKLVGHKRDLESIREELASFAGKDSDANLQIRDLESKLNWHQEFAHHLCANFLFAASNKQEGESPCILLDPGQTYGSIPMPETKGTEMMDLYKFQYIHLYERQAGIRLASRSDSSEKRSKETGSNNWLTDMTTFLASHLHGQNNQILVAMESPEYCARACTLQTHGPRPSCASFEFVFERTSDQSCGRKYCLLNSQSLHDLRRRNGEISSHIEQVTQLQAGNSSTHTQYWHFEPRETLLFTPDTSERDADILMLLSTRTLAQGLVDSTSLSERQAQLQTMFSLTMILFVSLTGGLIVGFRIAKLWQVHTRDPEEITLKYKMIRMVHRLSGVSLSHMRESEVRM